MRDLLDGRTGPVRDIVILNAAAALVAYDGPVADDLENQLAGALTRARDAIDSGAGEGEARSLGLSDEGLELAA